MSREEADEALGGEEHAEEAGETVCGAGLTAHMQSRQSWGVITESVSCAWGGPEDPGSHT